MKREWQALREALDIVRCFNAKFEPSPLPPDRPKDGTRLRHENGPVF